MLHKDRSKILDILLMDYNFMIEQYPYINKILVKMLNGNNLQNHLLMGKMKRKMFKKNLYILLVIICQKKHQTIGL